jgi:phenylacetate-CoA ligase
MTGTDRRLLRSLLSELSHWPKGFEQTRALQTRQIRRLLEHAGAGVPFYKQIYRDAGFDPADFNSIDDIRRVPSTSRVQRQDTAETDLLSDQTNVDQLVRDRTSGSSGRPINIYRSRLEGRICDFVHWCMYRTIGVGIRDRRVSISMIKHNADTWYRRLGIFPMEKIDVSLPIAEILARLRQAKPDVLICSSSTAVWFAAEMQAKDRDAIRPRTVVTWGDTITPLMRQKVGSIFQAKVVDFYGSSETRMIAVQCQQTGLYHLYENMTFVEVLRDGRPVSDGEEGEVVITSLWSFAMPFIRYRQGDIATMGPTPCPCGAPVRTLREIQGRTLDLIPIPGKGTIHPYKVIKPVALTMPWIKRFQFVQQSPEVLRLMLVPEALPTEEQLNRVLGALQPQIGPMRLRIEIVGEIPMLPNGKFYPYVSLERQRAFHAVDHV